MYNLSKLVTISLISETFRIEISYSTSWNVPRKFLGKILNYQYQLKIEILMEKWGAGGF